MQKLREAGITGKKSLRHHLIKMRQKEIKKKKRIKKNRALIKTHEVPPVALL